MKFVIEAGGRFTGPSNGEPVGVYLDDYQKYLGEPNITQTLRSATLGAVGSGVLSMQKSVAIEQAIDAAPAKQVFRVPKSITPLVQEILSERFDEFIRSRTGALEGRIAAGAVSEKSELYQEYEWNRRYLNGETPAATPVHVTSGGFVRDILHHDHEIELEHALLYEVDGPNLTKEQRDFALKNNYLFSGRFVPMRASYLREPIVTGLPVPTIGVEEGGQFIPKVVMHTESPNDWQPVTW